MMFPALPEFIVIKKIFGLERLGFKVRDQAGRHAQGIEQNPIWILQNIKLYIHQMMTDMLSKTGPRQQDLLRIVDPVCRRTDLNRQEKRIHFNYLKYFSGQKPAFFQSSRMKCWQYLFFMKIINHEQSVHISNKLITGHRTTPDSIHGAVKSPAARTVCSIQFFNTVFRAGMQVHSGLYQRKFLNE